MQKIAPNKSNGSMPFTPWFGSIESLLERHGGHRGDKEALVAFDPDSGEERSLTYAELRDQVHRTANFLWENGIRKGDRIAFALPNIPEVLILELAVGLIGASSVPLDSKRDTCERKQFKLTDAGAAIAFLWQVNESAADEIETLKQAMPSVAFISLKDATGLQSLVSVYSSELAFTPSKVLEREFLLLYTSGTTAQPKGVTLPLRSLFANAQGIADWQQLTPDDRFLIVLPLHHINSTTMSLATLCSGGTVVLASRYSAFAFWECATRYQATLTSIVPTIVHDLLARPDTPPAPTLKRILIGSAPVDPKETERFIDTFGVPVVQGYGQTETALRVTGVPVDLSDEQYRELVRANSIGAELTWSEVVVRKEDGTEAEEGEEGEICIRGPVVSNGYWNNDEETRKSFSNGWFRSGDLGYWEYREGRKYFFIKGRIKEIIIKGGVNLSPSAIEEALRAQFSELEDICVVGYPDPRMGEEVAVVATLVQESSERERRELERKIEQLGRGGSITGLSYFESPSRVYITTEPLPRTATGKLQRTRVKSDVAAWLAAEEKERGMHCRRISADEAAVLHEAVRINNERWAIASDYETFRLRAANGYLLGAFDARGDLYGTVSCLQVSKDAIEQMRTWDELTGSGTFETHTPGADVFVCAAITVRSSGIPHRAPRYEDAPEFRRCVAGEQSIEEAAHACIAAYVESDLDNAIRFHRRPKAGLERGAFVTRIIKDSRPEDTAAFGYNVLMEYSLPADATELKETANATPSNALMEYALSFALQQGCRRVVALTRPAQLREHVASVHDSVVRIQRQ